MAKISTKTKAAPPHLGPRDGRRLRLALLIGYPALPLLAAAYGFARGGGDGAAARGFIVLASASLLIFDAAHLLRWLTTPGQPPPWRFERPFWTVAGALGVAVFVAAAVLIGAFDPIEEHGLDGWADGLIAGFVSAGLLTFVAARLHAWLTWVRAPRTAVDNPQDRSALQAALAPTLTELESVRLDAGRHIRRRAAWLTPIGAGLLLAAWVVWLLAGGELNLFAPPIAVVIGAGAGHVVATRQLAAKYEQLYKARVLPRLVGLFGALAYERPPKPDLDRLRRFHVFPRFSSAGADDAISGQYRGLTISIVQLGLARGWGPTHKRVFQGLLIELCLKNRLTGTTAIAADAGALGNLLHERESRKIARVGLESAAFEREYEVYGTDQVMARALLTPSFMERFQALGRTEGFAKPLALAEDNMLLIALPRAPGRYGVDDFFEPPGYDDPANDDAVLTRLYNDIEAMLGAADAVIALDDETSREAARAQSPGLAGVDG